MRNVPDVDLARSRFRGAFLGCMVGDALGRSFEMMSPGDARLAPALRALLLEATPLRYSDDTEMMLAVATSMVRS